MWGKRPNAAQRFLEKGDEFGRDSLLPFYIRTELLVQHDIVFSKQLQETHSLFALKNHECALLMLVKRPTVTVLAA